MQNVPIKRPHWSPFIMKIFLNIANVGLKNFPPTVVIGDGSNRCGHQLHTDSYQNKVQTYQFNEKNKN